ncbi:nuclear cap-binding protein subunit 1 [Pelomyxa schiedti]|nr:nuclear cap-binding protein subunit 1 [Pelomyxa schiedti]
MSYDRRSDNRPSERESRYQQSDSGGGGYHDDYQSRGGGYRGGGGGGGSYRGRGGGGGRYRGDGGSRSPEGVKPAPHYTLPQQPPPVCPLLITLGDKEQLGAQTLESKLEDAIPIILSDYAKNQEAFIDLLMQCVCFIPIKTHIYATVVGLARIENREFGEKVVSKLQEELQDSFTTMKDTRTCKLLLRFLAELVNASVIASAVMLKTFDILLSSLQEKDQPRPRSDFFLYLIMATLPWVARTLVQTDREAVTNILNHIEEQMSGRADSISALSVWEDEGVDYLQWVWQQTAKANDCNWHTDTILQPYTHFLDKLSVSRHHSYTSFLTIPPNRSDYIYPKRKATFFILAAESETAPLDRFIAEEYIVDTLFYFNASPKDAIKQLMQLSSFTDAAVIMEVIFAQMFQLPSPPFRLLYYGVLIAELCKVDKIFVSLMVKSTDVLFNHLETMDAECVDRFSEWFSWHLTNFDHLWGWASWDAVLHQPEIPSAKTSFVRDTLEHCVCLSYWERVQRAIPPAFMVFMPAKPTPSFPWGLSSADQVRADQSLGQMAAKMLEKLQSKTASDQLKKWLDSIVCDGGVSVDSRLSLFIFCVLHIGSKSISHLTAPLERYHQLLGAYITSAADRQKVLSCIVTYWLHSTQRQQISIERFLAYKLLDPQSVINWIFSGQQLESLVRFHPWRILYHVIFQKLAAPSASLNSAAVNKTGTGVPSTPTKSSSTTPITKSTATTPSSTSTSSTTSSTPSTSSTTITATTTSASMETEETRKPNTDSDTVELQECLNLVLQNFATVLSDHLDKLKEEPDSFWYRKTLGHLRAFLRRFWNELQGNVGQMQHKFSVNPRLSHDFSGILEAVSHTN